MWNVIYSRQSIKDSKKIEQVNLKQTVKRLIEVIKNDPFQNPPPYEKLVGDLKGKYSRRINVQHRLVYEVFEKENIVRILRMWTHYE
ncbi:MAG: Txe/YoeB family addiction module toxin [Treponema sp.]